MPRIVKASVEFFDEAPREELVIPRLARIGRTAYQSYTELHTLEDQQKFISMIIRKKHLSVLEHENVTVRIICDRGITHQTVRHRLASYIQESTRYCNYSKEKFDNVITVIDPCFWQEPEDARKRELWHHAMMSAEQYYLELLDEGATPEEARTVLPNSTKAEIIITTNLRQWLWILANRGTLLTGKPHPQMLEVMGDLLVKFNQALPTIFGKLVEEEWQR